MFKFNFIINKRDDTKNNFSIFGFFSNASIIYDFQMQAIWSGRESREYGDGDGAFRL